MVDPLLSRYVRDLSESAEQQQPEKREKKKQKTKQFDQLHHYRSRDEDGTSGKVGGNDGDVLRSFHNDPSRLVTRRERRKMEE